MSTSRAARAPVQLPGCTRTCASRPHPAERVRSLSPLPPVKRYKIEQKPARRRALPRPPRLRSPSLPGLASRLRSAAHSSRHVQPGAGPPARPPPPRSPIPPPLSAWVGSGRGGQAARRGSAPLPSSRRRDWGAGRRGRGRRPCAAAEETPLTGRTRRCRPVRERSPPRRGAPRQLAPKWRSHEVAVGP